MASAIVRSKPEPSLRRSAGARLTVMRLSGHSSSAETMPLRTRSFRLLAGPVGQPDDGERRHPFLQVRLHLHPPRLQPDERVGQHLREHALRLERERSRVCDDSVPKGAWSHEWYSTSVLISMFHTYHDH